MRKRIIATACLMLSIFTISALCGCQNPDPANEDPEDIYENYWEDPDSFGIQSINGLLKLGGKDYYGIGLNFYNLFNSSIESGFSSEKAFSGLEILAQYQIPVLRFNAGVFYYNELRHYFENKQLYLSTIKSIVDKAEELRIGLIPSFFWKSNCVPDYYDEPIRRWGDSDSDTREFMREYTLELVNLLKDSKAIWGWEFGNEFNLAVDLPNADKHVPALPKNSSRSSRTAEDYLKTVDINSAYKEFAKIVGDLDDKNRFISSGNGNLRPSQYNQYASNATSWQQDTQTEHKEITLMLNPEGYGVICEHLYFLSAKYFGNDNLSLSEYVMINTDIAKEAKKPYFVGEFGSRVADIQTICQMVETFVNNKVHLALLWNYAPVNTNVEHSFNESAEYGRSLLELIEDYNRQLRQRGGN